MKALVFEQFGDPRAVLQVREKPRPEPGPGEVRVRMRLSPINPSDLLVVRGQYGRLPQLPATPGFEGVGVIDAVGPGLLAKLRGLKPGRRVAALNGPGGNWAQEVVLSARNVVPVPDDIPDEQVASFFVNPATALVMTRHVLRVHAGSWLVQTAAASALGRMIIRLARNDGYRTVNIVRRRSHEAELRALGADAVLVSGEDDVPKRILEVTGGGAPYALDAVGGPVAMDVIRGLGPGATLLFYGTLSGEPVPLESRLLMSGQKRLQGFWLSEWVPQQGPLRMLRLFAQITSLLRAGVLTSPPGGSYAMENIGAAIDQVEKPGGGKVLLKLDG